MTENHPITPPPELLQQWATEYWGNPGELIGNGEKYIAIQAARWGADQELNECCKWLPKLPPWSADDLRKHRRPKPPTLAKQALLALYAISTGTDNTSEFYQDIETVQVALKRLQELENN